MFQNKIFDTAKRSLQAVSKLIGKTALVLTVASVACAAPALANPKYSGIVVDAKSGKVLYSEEADGQRYPASLTKMMTLYLTFEALERGRITTSTKVPFSKKAALEPPSKLGVGAGRAITVEQAILALVTRSANDAASALGEMLGGSEARFAKMMTNKARALGMTRTTYRNAHGLPNTGQTTTARDQARLGLALRQHFPQYYSYFSTRSFKFGKQVIGNHNRLLGNVRGVDGIKTGYIRASGFNLVTSLQTDGRSIVAVVMGGTSGASRDAQMRRLVERYLPKASRSGKAELIAEARTPEPVETAPEALAAAVPEPAAQVASSAFALPDSGPVPDFRYSGETRDLEVAFAAPAARTPEPFAAATSERAPLIDTQITNSLPEASGTASDGWVVQIGATESEAQAMVLLETAKDKVGKALVNAKPFTIAFNQGGGQLYRARFGGFNNQDKAVSACRALKKSGFSCWASLQ